MSHPTSSPRPPEAGRHGLDFLRSPVEIRDARESDLEAIRGIYAPYVTGGRCTFEEEVPTLQQMQVRREDLLRLGLPWLVAVSGGEVVGYAYAGPHRPRPAYRHTVENAVYVARGLQGRGIGKALLGELIARCAAGGFRSMVAVIGDSANAGSIGLHARMGFEPVGVLKGVGFKLDRWVDTVLMQRLLG